MLKSYATYWKSCWVADATGESHEDLYPSLGLPDDRDDPAVCPRVGLVSNDDGDLDHEQFHRDGDLRRRKASVAPQRQKETSAIAEQLSHGRSACGGGE